MCFGTIKNRKTFLDAVGEEEDNRLVLVECHTTWCPNCKAVQPKIDQLNDEYDGKVPFYKMNIEEAEDVAFEYGIQMVPTFVLFKGGEKIDEVSGPKDQKVKEMIEKNM